MPADQVTRPVGIAPAGAPGSLLDIADELWEKLPGFRVEIIGGRLIVTPPADGMHADALQNVTETLMAARLHRRRAWAQGPGITDPE